MGEKNVAVNQWLGSRQRFADLFNGCIFGGKHIVNPEELEVIDRESDIIVTDQHKKRQSYQRYRDIVMGWKGNTLLAILACETQDKIHYGMPIRNMLYDALTYNDQMKRMWEAHGSAGMSQEEYLSRFEKGGKLQPVITLVFYYGEKEWDASRDLYGMFDVADNMAEIIRLYVPNYKINLINPYEVENINAFCIDLQIVFKMLQYKNNKTDMIQFLENNKEYFSAVDLETYNIIRLLLDLKNVLNEREETDYKEGYDMCKAFDDWYAEAVQLGHEDGMKQGIEQGVERGAAKNLLENIQKIMSKGYSLQEACELVEVTFAEYEAAKELLEAVPVVV